MTLNLRNIFRQSYVTSTGLNSTVQGNNSENLQQGETYEHWGMRVCAITNGGVHALTSYLQRVYNYIYQNQVNNQILQDEQRRRIQLQVEQKQSDIDNYNLQLAGNNGQREECRRREGELLDEMMMLKNQKYRVNKDAKLKMIIGRYSAFI